MSSMNFVRLMTVWCALASGTGALADQCPPKPPNGSPAVKRLLLAGKTSLTSLDPYALNDNFILGLLGNVYEGLVKRSPSGELVGALAERWEKIDETHWRFYLRQNIKFQKGQEFSADDVVYSAARVRRNGSDLKSILPNDAKVVKIDAHTIEVVLSNPNPGLIAEWDSWYILSKPWIEPGESADPSKFDPQHGLAATTANGTGPFIVTSHKVDERTEFAPNPNWWIAVPPRFDLVEFCPMPSKADRLDALLSNGSNRVDWIDAVPPADWQRVLQSSSAKAAIANDFQVVFLGFDVARDELTGPYQGNPNPFKEPGVRKAVYQAIDVNSIQVNIMHNQFKAASSLVATDLFAPAGQIERWKFDPKAAEELLAKTSYPDGFQVAMDCPTGRYTNDSDVCVAVKNMLSSIGIEVTVNKLSWREFTAKVMAGGNYDTSFYLFGWAPGSLDALNALTSLLTCRDEKAGRGSFNSGGYCNPAVDALLDRIKLESDEDTRNDLILQALQIVHQDIPVVPLHQQKALRGLSKALNVVERRDGRIIFGEFQ